MKSCLVRSYTRCLDYPDCLHSLFIIVLLDHRRHHSGDSLASQSSTSTQLSASQQSISSDSKHDGLDQAPNQPLAHTHLSNQQTAQTSTINQIPSRPTQSCRRSAQPPTNELSTEISIANNIPTVVDSISNRVSDTSSTKPPLRKSTSSISVITDTEPAAVSPLVSPAASGKKPSRKRRRSTASSTDSKQSTDVSAGQHKCLWESCGLGFSSCAMLRKHASKIHTCAAGACMWAGCDRVERKRWALVSHVNVSVCNVANFVVIVVSGNGSGVAFNWEYTNPKLCRQVSMLFVLGFTS